MPSALTSALTSHVPSHVALLHSIVLGPGRRVVMADLRAMAEGLGFGNARTLVSTGNLVFDTGKAEIATLESLLEGAFRENFGKHVDIIVRQAEDWRRIIAGNPFPGQSEKDGSRVGLRVMRSPLADDAVVSLARCCTKGEEIALVGGDLWMSFSGKPSESKLLPALTTKRLGIGTIRNWNTVAGLGKMLG